MSEDLLKIRVTADFKEAEGAFLRLAKVATAFEKDIRGVSATLSKEFNRIEGSAKLFGDYTNVVKDKMDALRKSMNSLLTLGVQPLNPAIQKLKEQYNLLRASIEPANLSLEKNTAATKASTIANNAAAGSLNKGNRQWTNLALVVQDLPYGFRGIQNNLPALLGGIAGVGGAAYLAFSVIISGLTMFDEYNRKVAASTKKIKEEQDEYAESLKNATANGYSEVASIKALLDVAADQKVSMSDRLIAVGKLQKEYPSYFGNLNKEAILNGQVAQATFNVATAILAKARAKAVEEKIGKLSAQQLADEEEMLRLQIVNEKLTNERYELNKLIKNESTDIVAIGADIRLGDEESAATKIQIRNITAEILKNSQEINKLNVSANESLKEQDRLQFKLNDLTKTGIKLGQEKAKVTKDKKVEEDPAYYTKIIEQEQKTFTDSLDNELKYADDNSTKKVEILQRYTSELNYWHELGFIQESFYLNKAADLHKQLYDTRKSIAEQDSKEQNTINERNLQNSLDALKIQSDVETKILLKGGKSTAAERIKILEDYKNKLYDLASVGGYTAAEFDKIDDALIRVNAAIDGSKDKLKDYKVSMVDVTNSLNTIIRETLTKLGTSLGENIGKMLSQGGGIKDVMNSFLGILADGLIQIGQLAIATGFAIEGIKKALENLNPVVAIAAGIALVALGTYVKGRLSESSKSMSGGGAAKAFANGGIVSGPTMGLIGEYPGASSNPEVVAPLDKLKDIIGGGGGSFVLRGTDLVLALNRSETSLNLRRGS